MEREKMICEPNEVDGRFLLGEIMRGGNFGHHVKSECLSLNEKKTDPMAKKAEKWLQEFWLTVIKYIYHRNLDVKYIGICISARSSVLSK